MHKIPPCKHVVPIEIFKKKWQKVELLAANTHVFQRKKSRNMSNLFFEIHFLTALFFLFFTVGVVQLLLIFKLIICIIMHIELHT